jgi:Outer membrane protein beta-barrel domain
MKKFFLAVVILGFTQASKAQIKIGAIGGLTFANQRWVSNTQNFDASIKTKTNFMVGVTSDIPLSAAFSFQPELYYSRQNTSVSQSNLLLNNFNTYKLGYLKMPACITYMHDFNKAFWFVGAGPYVANLASTDASFIQNDIRLSSGSMRVGTGTNDQITPWDFGLKFKAGFEIKKGISMNLYYEQGLKDVNPQFVQTYNRVFGFAVSYLFSVTAEDKYNRYPDDYNY